MKQERISLIQKSALPEATERTRNKHIQEAYNSLVGKISNKLDNNFNRAWNKFPRVTQHETNSPNLIQEFYTPVCSVILYQSGRNYIIKLTVTEQSLQPGHGVYSTALVRLAFEATDRNTDNFRVSDSLQIAVDNNIEAVYKQKVTERTDRQNLAYFNKKMKIEG